MILIAASWPSNKEAAVTNRNGALSVRPTTPGKSLAATLMTQESSEQITTEISTIKMEIPYKSIAFIVENILI
jgi:hypothetical protein